MKKLSLLGLLFVPFLSIAQSFDNPESAEYDAANNRWLVGNHGSGEVLEYSPSSGTLTSFCSGMTSGPYGIEILGNVLYCCDGSRVRGYNLTSGNEVFNLNLGASFLNGITTDGVQYIFVTDFTAKKIYRVNTLTNTFNVMVTTTLTPNGIVYDGPNNRLVFVTWLNSAPIQALSLIDSTVSTLANTNLNNLDGIVRDQSGNWYVSAWGPMGLHKFDPAFANASVAVMTGVFTQPADLEINAAGDSISIPNSGSMNNVVFYTVPSGGCDEPLLDINAMYPLCYGEAGAVELTVSGGAQPYSYLWSTGASTEDLDLVMIGDYSVTVIDAVDCTASASTTVIQPDSLSITLTATPSTQPIPNCNGSINAVVSGATPDYTLTWNNGMISTENLCSGTYTVTLQDFHGCSTTASVFVDEVLDVHAVAASPIEVTIFPNPADDVITLNANRPVVNGTIELVDMLGKVLNAKSFEGTTCLINASALPAGCYRAIVRENALVVNRKTIMINR